LKPFNADKFELLSRTGTVAGFCKSVQEWCMALVLIMHCFYVPLYLLCLIIVFLPRSHEGEKLQTLGQL
jgi:hypothetical protein